MVFEGLTPGTRGVGGVQRKSFPWPGGGRPYSILSYTIYNTLTPYYLIYKMLTR